MYKYIPIEAILNYIPEAVKEEESSKQLLSWAHQAFRSSHLEWRYDYKVVISEVINHKACVPPDANRIAYVSYSIVDFSEDLLPYIVVDYPNGLDDSDKRFVLYQKTILQSELLYSFYPMKYVGQSPALLTKDCLNLYCKDCSIGFSVSKDMSFIQLDQKEGFALIVYSSEIKDENGNIMIPDDVDLIQGCAYFAQAQYWLNKASRHEATAMSMFEKFMQLSQQLMTKAKGKYILRNVNTDINKQITFGRKNIMHLTSANNRNKWTR